MAESNVAHSHLELSDIQGNIVQAYGGSYAYARYLLFAFHDSQGARQFVADVLPLVTSAQVWETDTDQKVIKPPFVVNISFSFDGIRKLGVPDATLKTFPPEFVSGMQARKEILGDDGPSDPVHWDPVWQKEVHACIAINALTVEDRELGFQALLACVDASSGAVELLTGHRGKDGADWLPWQDAQKLLLNNGQFGPKEHFGYTDGISDPVFKGQPQPPGRLLGRGKLSVKGTWEPLAAGEFLLGHIDEAREYPTAPSPVDFARNGTFMVFRKLHENVGTFNELLKQHGDTYPGGTECFAAKLSGRWRDNGAPVTKVPDPEAKEKWDSKYYQLLKKYQELKEKEKPGSKGGSSKPLQEIEIDLNRMLSDFHFSEDIEGVRCPLSAHNRRVNPRGSLEFGVKNAFETPSGLADRRRIMRRGLPYGEVTDPTRNDGDHGIIFLALNANIKRQFEFVQQQWLNYGNDFRESNNKDVLLGNHSDDLPSNLILPVSRESKQGPYFVSNLQRLVEVRGGEYFFIPSISALNMLAIGSVDPT